MTGAEPPRKVTKSSVHYQRRPLTPSSPAKRCGTCSMFRVRGVCTLVAGVIRPGDVCDRWEATP